MPKYHSPLCWLRWHHLRNQKLNACKMGPLVLSIRLQEAPGQPCVEMWMRWRVTLNHGSPARKWNLKASARRRRLVRRLGLFLQLSLKDRRFELWATNIFKNSLCSHATYDSLRSAFAGRLKIWASDFKLTSLVQGAWFWLTGQDRNVTQSARPLLGPLVRKSAGTPSQWLSASESDSDCHRANLPTSSEIWARGPWKYSQSAGRSGRRPASALLSMGLRRNLKNLGLGPFFKLPSSVQATAGGRDTG